MPLFSLALGLAGVAAGCGGSAPPARKVDLYGARVSACIDAQRVENDAAQGRMLVVRAGTAVLGSSEPERAQARNDYGPGGEALFADEYKPRRAYVRGFKLDATPVTAQLYAEFVSACGVLPPDPEVLTAARWQSLRGRFGLQRQYDQIMRFLWPQGLPAVGRERHPMVLVRQDDAGFYCAWRGGRLPTEDEWERAARGPAGNAYPWGSRYDPFRVSTLQRGAGDTVPVGSLPQGNTAEGFADMGGLVQEWTETPWPGKPGYFVVKGNGWDGRGGYGRGAARIARSGEAKDVTLGFRCAADF